MKDIYIRLLTFIIGCIGFRLYLAYFAKNNEKYLPLMGKIAILPAIGFIVIYLFDLRKTGAETFGKPIWWNNLRPIHALFYLLFSYYAIKKTNYSWKFLLIDALFGLSAFLFYHIRNTKI
jgi:hypothetical protein